MRNGRDFRPYILPLIFCCIVGGMFLGALVFKDVERENIIGSFLIFGMLLYFSLEFVVFSTTKEDVLDDPIIGKIAEVTVEFLSTPYGFEGRVLVNGAPWMARCEARSLQVGDKALVVAIVGQLLLVEVRK